MAASVVLALAVLCAGIAVAGHLRDDENKPTTEVSESEKAQEEPVLRVYNNATCEYLDPSKTYSVGDHLLFGSYEQDADESNGAGGVRPAISTSL